MFFYYDQRIRLEGFDIEWMMQRAGLVVPPSASQESALATPATLQDGEVALSADAARTPFGEPL